MMMMMMMMSGGLVDEWMNPQGHVGSGNCNPEPWLETSLFSNIRLCGQVMNNVATKFLVDPNNPCIACGLGQWNGVSCKCSHTIRISDGYGILAWVLVHSTVFSQWQRLVRLNTFVFSSCWIQFARSDVQVQCCCVWIHRAQTVVVETNPWQREEVCLNENKTRWNSTWIEILFEDCCCFCWLNELIFGDDRFFF